MFSSKIFTCRQCNDCSGNGVQPYAIGTASVLTGLDSLRSAQGMQVSRAGTHGSCRPSDSTAHHVPQAMPPLDCVWHGQCCPLVCSLALQHQLIFPGVKVQRWVKLLVGNVCFDCLVGDELRIMGSFAGENHCTMSLLPLLVTRRTRNSVYFNTIA